MKQKPISHFERTHMSSDCCVECSTKPTIRQVRVQSLDEKTNRIRTKIVMKTIDRAEEMRPYKVSDFCLENLTAVGAQLNPTHLSASPHRAITDMQRTLSNIDVEPSNNE